MSDAMSDGGPAFPRQHAVADANDPAFKIGAIGMSLRDYFAAAALTGLCASFDGPCLDDAFVEGVARRSFDVADAMLAARERKEESK